ncbi:MAG: hypothetical protein E7295_10760 [Lachnospiraceae bacterium]|jgi:hypothetical protein|nr:hypothetical protein [Lachnospiraceae bacterium]
MLVQDQFEIEDGVLKAYLGAGPEVQIPEGVHTIGEGALKGMAWLLKVSLPSSLKRIGATAFKGCRQLREITFPEGLEEIGEYAFHRCHKIKEMIFPKSLTKVDGYVFLYCDGLKRVVMEGPERLGKAVFSHNLLLEEVTLNKNVDASNFSEEVFEGCVHLRKITLSGEAYEISNLIEAMNSHSTYPSVIKSIAKSVYHSMQIEDGVLNKFHINLKSIMLPEGITAIGKSCFFDKKGIVSITLPKSLQEIRANAFNNCVNLEEITIQNENLLLDDKAFRGCCHLKKAHLLGREYLLEDATPNELISRIQDQVWGDFYLSGKTLLRYLGDEEQIQIPKGVEIIGERCFFGKERLRIVECPNSLLEIREQAFAGCVTLQNIVLSDKLKRIEREAFAECKKLLKCCLPASVEFIGEYAFRRCFQLKPFEPWPQKADIHPYAFYLAKQFQALEKEKDKYPGDFRQGEVVDQCVEGCIAPYAHARREEIKTLSLTDISRIGKYAFAACPNLEEITIDAPECVIEQNAFSTCPKLKKVWLNIKELGKGCFSYCRSLEEVHLSGVSVLPMESFAGCYSLSKFEAKDIQQMEARCFDECTALDSFDFSGIRVIGERAFERCEALKKVELHQVECGFHAFADCASLESVELSKDTVLKSGAFIGCTQVRSITYASERYEFSRFSDGLNHVGNLYPMPVREVIASIYSCFDVRERKILAGYTQDSTEVTIPQDIEEIGQDVFRDHVRLQKIHIPQSVKIFGNHAFFMTAWLEEQRKASEMVIVNQVLLDGALCEGRVELPHTIRRVASWCFAGNTKITELVIPSERIGIESLSFRNCLNLKRITDWNQKEYVLSNVSDLTDKEYPELIQRIFSECINCFKLDESGNLIESTGNITKLTFPEGIKAVGDGVYKDCHLLEEIALSKDTTRIGKSAFENSKWLKCVTNAGAITSIGAQAFTGCQSLETIDLSDCLQELGNRCFEHCVSLTGISLSPQLQKIPERAFFRCKSLRKIIIPPSVKIIEAEAFAFCDNLEEIHIPEETQLDEKAFIYCDNLRVIKYSTYL